MTTPVGRRTYGEQFNEAAKCETKEEAAMWLEKELRWYQGVEEVDKDQAIKNIAHNLLFGSRSTLQMRSVFRGLLVGPKT